MKPGLIREQLALAAESLERQRRHDSGWYEKHIAELEKEIDIAKESFYMLTNLVKMEEGEDIRNSVDKVMGLVAEKDKEIERLRALTGDDVRRICREELEILDKIENLTDRLNEGIKYVKEENQYVLVWTQRELDLAKTEADEIYNLFKDSHDILSECHGALGRLHSDSVAFNYMADMWIALYFEDGEICNDCKNFIWGPGGPDPSYCKVLENGLDVNECPALEDYLEPAFK